MLQPWQLFLIHVLIIIKRVETIWNNVCSCFQSCNTWYTWGLSCKYILITFSSRDEYITYCPKLNECKTRVWSYWFSFLVTFLLLMTWFISCIFIIHLHIKLWCFQWSALKASVLKTHLAFLTNHFDRQIRKSGGENKSAPFYFRLMKHFWITLYFLNYDHTFDTPSWSISISMEGVKNGKILLRQTCITITKGYFMHSVTVFLKDRLQPPTWVLNLNTSTFKRFYVW